MHEAIPDKLMPEMSRLVDRHTGLYFSEKNWPTLKKGLAEAARQLGQDTTELIVSLRLPFPPPALITALSDRLTIGETYFLRDKNVFRILQERVIPNLARHPRREKQKMVFWSAGCASGEEPYSLAIIIDELLPTLKNWDITIMGSDISPAALTKAESGIYSNWSLRETPEHIIKKYFKQIDDYHFELARRIRDRVSFSRMNLMVQDYGAGLGLHEGADVIFFRNVMIYFKEETRRLVIDKLTALLVNNGWLIPGPSEIGFVQNPQLTRVPFSGGVFYRKGKPRRSDLEPQKPAHPPHFQAPGPPDANIRPARRRTDTLPPSQTDKDDYDIYQEALEDYQKGRYRDALDRLAGIAENGDGLSKAQLIKADALFLSARCHANLGALNQAIAFCEKALQSEKLNPEIHFLMATLHQSGGDPAAAVRFMKQAIYLNPGFIMAHFILGILFLGQGRRAESAKCMKTALSLLQSHPPEEVFPHSEGMTASQMIETIESMTTRGLP